MAGWERLLFGLLGVGVAAVALFMTVVGIVAASFTLQCAGAVGAEGAAGDPRGVAVSIAVATSWLVVCGVVWLAGASLLRLALRDRPLGGRAWLGVLQTTAVVGLIVCSVWAAVRPEPPATCAPHRLYSTSAARI